MGTHPIFESDFDCLTGCCLSWPVPLLGSRLDRSRLLLSLRKRPEPPKLPHFSRIEFLDLAPLVTSKKPVKSWLLVTVSPVFTVSETSRPKRWSSSPLVSRVWL